MIKPSKKDVVTPSLKKAIEDNDLKLESKYRENIENLLKDARNPRDPAGIAYTAFSLAYSLDHFDPYDFNRAIQLLGEALSHFPEWPEALFNRGIARIHARDFEGAIQDFETAVRSCPQAGVPQANNLFKGKLLMFLAEAHRERGLPGDLELSRANLVRAEVYLVRYLDVSGLSNEAQFWIDQVPIRLKETLARDVRPTSVVKHLFGFLLGLILVPFILWWLVTTTTPIVSNPSTVGQIVPDEQR